VKTDVEQLRAAKLSQSIRTCAAGAAPEQAAR
jgi:hypothetical protein